MEDLRNSAILKKLGLNHKTDWLLYDEKAMKFFEHLAENIGDENILTPEELQFQDSSDLLRNEEIQKELQLLEMHFPGILSVSRESNEEIEQEIKFLEADTAKRLLRVSLIEETEKQQLKDLEKINKSNLVLDFKVQQFIQLCNTQCGELVELQKSNQEMIRQSKDLYLQPQNPPSLMHRMSLNDFNQKCDQLLGHLKMFMQQFFNVSEDEPSHDMSLNCNESIVDIKRKLQEIESRKLDDSLSLSGVRGIIDNISVLKVQANSNVNNLRKMIDDVETDNDRLSFQFEMAQRDVKMHAFSEMNCKITKLLHEYLKEKNKRAIKRLDSVELLFQHVDNATILCEFLWAQMQIDVEKLNNRADNSEQYTNEILNSSRRMSHLKAFYANNDENVWTHDIFNKFQDTLKHFAIPEFESLDTTLKCIQEFLRFGENVERSVKLAAEQKVESPLVNSLQSIVEQAAALRDLVFDGPTKFLQLYDSKFLVSMHEKEQKKKDIENTYDQAKKNYKKNIIDPWESDKAFAMGMNLWIYFLADPKKVIDSIKEVQKKAALRGNSSFNALNINLTKH